MEANILMADRESMSRCHSNLFRFSRVGIIATVVYCDVTDIKYPGKVDDLIRDEVVIRLDVSAAPG